MIKARGKEVEKTTAYSNTFAIVTNANNNRIHIAAEIAKDLFKYLMWGPFSSSWSDMLSLTFMINKLDYHLYGKRYSSFHKAAGRLGVKAIN